MLGWGLVGASTIAREYMIPAIKQKIPRVYATVDEMLTDPAVDGVSISATNERHYAPTIAAARAGTPMLCEKPLALTPDNA